jgi:disulfide bond formation protein DsbB
MRRYALFVAVLGLFNAAASLASGWLAAAAVAVASIGLLLSIYAATRRTPANPPPGRRRSPVK